MNSRVRQQFFSDAEVTALRAWSQRRRRQRVSSAGHARNLASKLAAKLASNFSLYLEYVSLVLVMASEVLKNQYRSSSP